MVIEVHNEELQHRRPSSLQQLQDMLDVGKLEQEQEDLTAAEGGVGLHSHDPAMIPQEKDGFLSRKVGYEIERRLVKAVQVRTLKKKKKKGHYHYYPFYEKQKGSFWSWIKRHFIQDDPNDVDLYQQRRQRRRQRRQQRRKGHHRFCLKCVTSSFQSLFRVLKEPIIYTNERVKKQESTEDNPEHANGQEKNDEKRAVSRANTDATRTPTPKMLLDMKSGAIHWPVYQFGGQSGSGMLVSADALVGGKKNKTKSNANEPGRENFSLGEQIEAVAELNSGNRSSKFLAADEDERKLIGWLQVRDPNNRKKTFVQVVNPKPEGPFRKAPWHGNVHVMKF